MSKSEDFDVKAFDEKVKAQRAAEIEEEKRQGIITVHYSDYKNNYQGYKTIPNSYDKKAKTIKVIVKTNSVCPKCKTFCYGDCQL